MTIAYIKAEPALISKIFSLPKWPSQKQHHRVVSGNLISHMCLHCQLSLLGPHFLWSVLQTLCGLILLPLLKASILVNNCTLIACPSKTCECRNYPFIIVVNIDALPMYHIWYILWNSKMIIQSLEGTQTNPSQTTLIKPAFL